MNLDWGISKLLKEKSFKHWKSFISFNLDLALCSSFAKFLRLKWKREERERKSGSNFSGAKIEKLTAPTFPVWLFQIKPLLVESEHTNTYTEYSNVNCQIQISQHLTKLPFPPLFFFPANSLQNDEDFFGSEANDVFDQMEREEKFHDALDEGFDNWEDR